MREKMRKKYIDVEALTLNLLSCQESIKEFGYPTVAAIIDATEAADVQEVRHGKWDMIVGFEFVDDDYKCSLCHCLSQRTKYCPNCGAKMDGRKLDY